jgi:predicted O-linked N-acetylglucosamine transferase (SPINDLY family)
MSEQLLQNAMRLHQTGKLADAARLYKDVLRANPRHFQALYLLGFLHFQKEEFEEAEKLIGNAIKLNPGSPDAYYNRGCALQKLKRDAEAVECFDRALALKPSYLEAVFNRGTSLLKLRRDTEALTCFDRVLVSTPRDPEAWHNRGDALLGLRRYSEAIDSLSRSLALSPNSERSLDRRAAAYSALKYYEEAASDYARLLTLKPETEHVTGHLIYCRLHCCDWRGLEARKENLAARIAAGKDAISPLENIVFSKSPADLHHVAILWTKSQCPPQMGLLWRGERYGHEKIRLAYVSGDFRTHAVGLVLSGIIEEHDRDRFEIIGISHGPDDDSRVRVRLKKSFDRFIDVDKLSDREAAELLRREEIDIAVDLMGFTGGCRPGIFAYRPAPVQVNYLGYPGTTGAEFMDYIVADKFVIPEEDFPHYTEHPVHMPHTFQPNDAKRLVAETTPTRTKEGLPESGFVFCSFNNSCKIMPEVFDVWMRLLHAVPDSVLWLPEYHPAEPANLKREAEARGIPPARIVFAKIVGTPEEYLARLVLADLFLDTSPYNAHTTASDALWMGLPLVTFLGTTYAGRVATSVLHAIGLPELATNSIEAYERLALELAQDRERLSALRRKLKSNRETEPLFNTKLYCRNLETAFAAMHARAERGEPPSPLVVTSVG